MNKRLKELRKNILNLTLKDFGNEISLSPGALGDIENGRRILQDRHIKLICQTFNVNEDWLRNGNEPIFIKDTKISIIDMLKENGVKPMILEIIENYLKMSDENKEIFDNYIKELIGIEKYNKAVENSNKILKNLCIDNNKYTINNINEELSITEEDIQEIRLYEIPASAGTGSFIDCDVPYEIKKVDLTVAPQARIADFALYVRGDSMEPDYYDGDIVFVKEQPCIDNGQIGIFIYDNVSYIKKYSIQDDGVYLISLNDKYKPIKVDKSTPFRTCGLVL